MIPKISAIKEELFTGCGFSSQKSFLYGNHSYQLFNQIVGKALLLESKSVRNTGNFMAILGVGSNVLEECLEVIAKAIEKSEFFSISNNGLGEALDDGIKAYAVAGKLLRNQANQEISSTTKEFSINLGLDLLLSFGYINTKEAAELKQKLYNAAELTIAEEEPTYDHNLKYIYELAFGKEKAKEEFSSRP